MTWWNEREGICSRGMQTRTHAESARQIPEQLGNDHTH